VISLSSCWNGLLLALLLAVHRPTAHAASFQRLDRIVALARLDAAVHFFHPAVAIRASDWDSSFAASVLRIADAGSTVAYARAIDSLIADLRDPLTRRAKNDALSWTAEWLSDSVLLVHSASLPSKQSSIVANAARARAVIFDLRRGDQGLPETSLARVLLVRRATAPPQRALMYSGFPPASIETTGAYSISRRMIDGETFPGYAAEEHNVAFLVDARTVLPAFALAMRDLGRGSLVGVGTATVTTVAATYRVSMGEGLFVDVRLAERIGSEAGLKVDSATDAINAISVARQRALSRIPIRPIARATSAVSLKPASPPETARWLTNYPTLGYRVLAAARLWGTIHLFYPYKALIGKNWDSAFRAALPAVENARTSLEFAEAISALAWHIHDSHVGIGSTVLNRELFGILPAPVRTRFLAGKLVITDISDSTALRAGLKVGDEVVAISGEPVAKKIARLAPYISSSTPQALENTLASVLLARRDYMPLRLSVKNDSGGIRNVELPPTNSGSRPPRRINDVIRVLPGNIGYADLTRLPTTMVDSMFRVLRTTNAIIFDMRGYPQGTAWAIAPRLNTHAEPTVAARFRRLIVVSPDTSQETTLSFEQYIPPVGGMTKYAGRTAMLIDERTISQAEHTGLFFEAANGTVFIGGPTAGADGDVTNVILPGNLSITFTGHDVRHADGRQLQRIGLVPTVLAVPTIEGVRSGRDEVLEVALKFLRGQPPRGGDTPDHSR
jgi:C-terminal processing protease CtpA/Prc